MKFRRLAWAIAGVIVLAVTVLGYRQPAVIIQLSEQIWACFG